MKNIRCTTILLLGGIISGCSLNDVKEDGDKCPPDENGKLLYIESPDCTAEKCSLASEEDQRIFANSFAKKQCPHRFPHCNVLDLQNNYFCSQDNKPNNFQNCSYKDQIFEHNLTHCFTDGNKSFLQKCNNGIWENKSDCSNVCNTDNTACSDEKLGCEFEDNTVTHGSLRCFSEDTGIIKACNNGVWENIENCSDGCNIKKTDCTDMLNACIDEAGNKYPNTDSHCFTDSNGNSYIKTCDNSEWKEQIECPNLSCNEQNTACGQCKNGDKNYENRMVKGDNDENHEICQSFTCANGSWVVDETPSCHDASCIFDDDGKATCGECVNGSSRCRDDNGKGIIEICVNGNWKEKKQCSYNNISLGCLDDTTCKECNDDQFIYYNEQDSTNADNLICQKYACQSGKWKDADGNLKKVDGYNCIGPCNDNAEDNCSCKEGDNCSCEENSTICTDKTDHNNEVEIGYTQTCHDKVWHKSVKCENDSSCQSPSECGNCQNGTSKCVNNDQNVGLQYYCESGKWIFQNSCNNNASCNADNKTCGECQIGKDKFEDQSDRTCKNFICTDGQWKENHTCENKFSCYKANDIEVINETPQGCGECVNYTFIVDENSPEYLSACINGHYVKYMCTKTNFWGKSVPSETEPKGEYRVCKLDEDKLVDKMYCYNQTENGVTIGYKRDWHGSTKKCSSEVSCMMTTTGTSECGVCQDGKTRCRTPQMQQTCLNGQWGFDQNCTCTGEGVCEPKQE